MCERLSELREALRAYAGSFDGACLDQVQAGAVVAEAAALEATASYLRGSAGARLADTGAFKDAGERSGAHHLARLSGTSVASAVEALATAKTMGELPGLEVVARQGKLSSAQLAVVADAAKADPTALSRLLSKAKKTSLAELREEAARIKAQADPDPEARRRRIHSGRFLRDYVDAEGAWNMRVRNNPEVGAQIKAAIAPITDRIFRAARKQARREPVEPMMSAASESPALVVIQRISEQVQSDIGLMLKLKRSGIQPGRKVTLSVADDGVRVTSEDGAGSITADLPRRVAAHVFVAEPG